MADKDESKADVEPTSADPLSTAQRVVSGVAGFAAAVAGGVSVFMTSNQAGSVALLAVGAGFLVAAINGMPILGAKIKDYELVMAPRRRKVVEEAEEQVKLERPAEANLALDVLQQVDPGARTDPAVAKVRTSVYQAQVIAAVAAAADSDGMTSVSITEEVNDIEMDFLLTVGDRKIYGDVKYSEPSRALSVRDLHRIYSQAERGDSKFLLVTNMRLTFYKHYVADTRRLLGDDAVKNVQVVRWVDDQDNYALKLALSKLLK